jgi:hypothetical protein
MRDPDQPSAAERIIIGVSQAREYDIRAAAPSYVTVIGAVGGFAVAVVILLLAEGHLSTLARHAAAVSVDLFMISLVGSVMAAFALGAISGEGKLDARVAAAGLIANSGLAVGVVALFAGFAVLSDVYEQTSLVLLALTTWGVGIAAALYIPSPVRSSPDPRPTDAWVWALRGIACVFPTAAMIYWLIVRPGPHEHSVLFIAGLAIAFEIGTSCFAMLRPTEVGCAKLGLAEAAIAVIAMSVISGLLIIAIP